MGGHSSDERERKRERENDWTVSCLDKISPSVAVELLGAIVRCRLMGRDTSSLKPTNRN